ncbi:MAG: isoprenylcysteine carboxylmethyltransferase family protein [Planctomycetota bacterium]
MNSRTRERLLAVAMALVCHGLFVLAVGSMALSLWNGLHLWREPASLATTLVVDFLLVAQFPLLHSWMLSQGGRRALRALVPWCGGRFATTTYACMASLQLLVAFWLWIPSGVVWYRPDGSMLAAHVALFACAWIFLVKALYDAGLPLQTGAAGWLAVWFGREVRYGGMPTTGLFAVCRQPIYLGFAMVLWTAPCWSLDWLLLTAAWTGYCAVGPRFKERRWLALYGERFSAYRRAVPYMLPRFR